MQFSMVWENCTVVSCNFQSFPVRIKCTEVSARNVEQMGCTLWHNGYIMSHTIMHHLHTPSTFTIHMHHPHASSACIIYIHHPYAQFICTIPMYYLHALFWCIIHMYNLHAQFTCTSHMYHPHAQFTCTICMHYLCAPSAWVISKMKTDTRAARSSWCTMRMISEMSEVGNIAKSILHSYLSNSLHKEHNTPSWPYKVNLSLTVTKSRAWRLWIIPFPVGALQRVEHSFVAIGICCVEGFGSEFSLLKSHSL